MSESTSFSSDQAQKAMNEVAKVSKGVALLKVKLNKFALKQAQLEQENIELKEHILSVECHQRRNNVVFEGFPESRGETDFDVYNKILRELSRVPHIGDYAYEINISRCHRLGLFVPGKKRPVIAHIHWYGDRQLMMQYRYELADGIYL